MKASGILGVATLIGVFIFVGWLWWSRPTPEQVKERAAAVAAAKAAAAASAAKAAAEGAPPDGSRIISVAPDAPPPASLPVQAGLAPNAAWNDIQQSSALRVRITQAMQSNDQQEAAAALAALNYCNTVGSRRQVTPAEVAAAELLPFPAQEALLRRSPVERRADEVEAARKRCAVGEDGGTRNIDVEARRNLSARLEGVTDLVRRLRTSDNLDWSNLTAEDRALLASGRTDVMARALGGMVDRWGALEEQRIDNDIAVPLAVHLAACRSGDACGPGSFRYGEVCVAYGACEGGDVEQAINRLIADDATRQRAQRLSTRIVSQLGLATRK